jgi:hypothetical protein
MRSRKKRKRRKRRADRGPARYPSFAAGLEQRAGLRQASFAVPAADAEAVKQAKRRFGPLAVARFIGAVLKAVVALCQNAAHK